MSSVVLKIKYGESLRRLVVPTLYDSLDLTFAQLEAKIREYFSIPAGSKLHITYVDQDGDSVTLAEDQELHDACLVQLLNPLRLFVSVEQQQQQQQQPGAKSPEASAFRKSAFEGIGDEVKPMLQAALKALDDASLKRVLEPVLKEGFISDILQSFSKHASAGETSAPGAASGTPEAGATPAADAAKGDGSKGVGPNTSEVPPAAAAAGVPPEMNSGAYHYNVQCDACGVCPIIGPRFKSLSKHDYDLCLSCFNQQPEGREAQYIRHDRPLPVKVAWSWPHPRAGLRSGSARTAYHHPQQYRCPYNGDGLARDGFWSSGGSRWGSSSMNSGGWGAAAKPESKPDCRFVCDVSIPDGTVVAPGTRLVKIWRLRNSGRISWPYDTRLVRAGGDQLGPVSAVALEMPSDAGLSPGAEVEVAVDLVAPEKAGRYVSYWRLMAPGGLKFGHRVWAMIQVTQAAASEAPEAPLLYNTEGPGASPKRPSESDGPVDHQEAFQAPSSRDSEVDDVVEVRVVASAPGAAAVVLEAGPEAEEVDSVVSEDSYDADESVEGFSIVEAPKEEEDVSGQVDAGARSPFAEGDSLVDGFLRMGFSDERLIAEFLAKNSNDFQKTLDDLVSAADWDPILVELEEMGFYDAQMNRRLMVKNNGSVTRVVKELVQMYKEPAPKN